MITDVAQTRFEVEIELSAFVAEVEIFEIFGLANALKIERPLERQR